MSAPPVNVQFGTLTESLWKDTYPQALFFLRTAKKASKGSVSASSVERHISTGSLFLRTIYKDQEGKQRPLCLGEFFGETEATAEQN